jgi:type I site-specific restriction-modification system R (restriction) subunit
LWKVQARAIRNLEESFGRADPRALIQMATGSGKTFTAVNVAYRLLKFGNAKRILFLVDRGNLGEQTDKEFANFEPPDDPRKFPTLYTVQRLKTNSINSATKVVITTIQRLYSMLKGKTEFDAGNEEGSAFDSAKPWQGERLMSSTTPASHPSSSTSSSWTSATAPFTSCGAKWYSISTRLLSASPPRPPARRSDFSTRTSLCNTATTTR